MKIFLRYCKFQLYFISWIMSQMITSNLQLASFSRSALVSVFLRLAGEGTSARVKYTARRAITNILRPHSTSHPAASFIGDAIHKTFRQSLIAELSKNASSRSILPF